MSGSINRANQAALEPLYLGSVRLDTPIVQAALSGYSDGPMRRIARRMGASYTLCEVMLDKFLVEASRSRKNRRHLQIADEEHPVGGQLMGADPELFEPAALRLVEVGFDVIDINFGCPVKKVLGRCRGGYHLSQPEIAIEIMQRVRSAVPPEIPVTVKMRRGIDDTPESHDRFYEIFEAAYESGLAAATVHGRTVTQRYIGPSRWEFLRELKDFAGDRIVLGSGDLFDAASCLQMMDYTGVDGVTVARGAIGNPWVFGQVAQIAQGLTPTVPTLHEQRSVIADHFRLAVELYGPEHGCRMMRKFGVQYAELHPESVAVRDAFVKTKQPSQWMAALDEWYSADAPGRTPPIDEPNPICEPLAASSSVAAD